MRGNENIPAFVGKNKQKWNKQKKENTCLFGKQQKDKMLQNSDFKFTDSL